jgi:hypothetical protein
MDDAVRIADRLETNSPRSRLRDLLVPPFAVDNGVGISIEQAE